MSQNEKHPMSETEKRLLREKGVIVGGYIDGGGSAKVYEIGPFRGNTNLCIKYMYDCSRENVEKEYAYYHRLYQLQPDKFVKVVDLIHIEVPDENYPEKSHHAAALVMEKLEKVDRQNRSLKTAVKILYDVALCIGIMQVTQIFHRDVKLDNILYSRRTNTYILIDYNISARGNETFVEQYCMGTMNNIAPESLKGGYSPRSDFYALGMTIREYFAGTELDVSYDTSLPKADRLAKLYEDKEKLRPFTEADVGCPQLAEVINKLTAFDRDDRYSDYKELIHALNKLVKELNLDISKMDIPYSVYFIAVNRNSPKFNVEEVRKLTNHYIEHYHITNSIVSIYSFAQDVSARTLKNGEVELVCEDTDGDFVHNLMSRTKKIYEEYNLSDKSGVRVCVAGARTDIRDIIRHPAGHIRRTIKGHFSPSSTIYSIALNDCSMDVSELGIDHITLIHDPTELEKILTSWFGDEKEEAS